MRRSGQHDIRIVVTGPVEADDVAEFTPFDTAYPDDLVYCCFFRELEQRKAFLDRLREIAGQPPVPEEERDAALAALSEAYLRHMREDDAPEAVFAAIRWRAGILRLGYHAYSLKVGFAPYRTSCVVSFRELSPSTIQQNIARALRTVENDRARVLDFFGFPGRSG